MVRPLLPFEGMLTVFLLTLLPTAESLCSSLHVRQASYVVRECPQSRGGHVFHLGLPTLDHKAPASHLRMCIEDETATVVPRLLSAVECHQASMQKLINAMRDTSEALRDAPPASPDVGAAHLAARRSISEAASLVKDAHESAGILTQLASALQHVSKDDSTVDSPHEHMHVAAVDAEIAKLLARSEASDALVRRLVSLALNPQKEIRFKIKMRARTAPASSSRETVPPVEVYASSVRGSLISSDAVGDDVVTLSELSARLRERSPLNGMSDTLAATLGWTFAAQTIRDEKLRQSARSGAAFFVTRASREWAASRQMAAAHELSSAFASLGLDLLPPAAAASQASSRLAISMQQPIEVESVGKHAQTGQSVPLQSIPHEAVRRAFRNLTRRA